MKTYPQINYTNTNEKITYNNNKLLRNNILGRITTEYQTNNQIKLINENISYNNSTLEVLQNYIITRKIINTTDYSKFIEKYNIDNSTYSITSKNGIKTYYLIDNSANIFSNILNLTWNRTTPTTLLLGVHNQQQYIENLEDILGIITTGNKSDQKTFELIMQYVIIKGENDILNSSIINLTKELQNINETDPIVDDLEMESPINPGGSSNDLFASIADFLDKNSDYGKSGLYKYLGFDENKSIVSNVLKWCGIDVSPDFNEFEAQLGNIMMTVGFSLLPEGGPVSLVLMGTGFLLSADGNNIASQNCNLSRWVTLGEGVLTSVSTGRLTLFQQAALKASVVGSFEKVNQRFTKKSDEDIVLSSAMQFVMGNKYSNKFDETVKKPLKNLGTENPKSRFFIKNIFFKKKYSKEDYFIISSVSKVMVSKETMISSFDYSFKQLLKEYYNSDIIYERANMGV